MRFSDREFDLIDTAKQNVIRPFLFRIEFRKFVKFINSAAKASVGKSSPSPLIEPIEKKTKILVIAPHPDDDILGCGGAIRKYCKNGSHVKVVFLTDGSHGNEEIEHDKLVAIRIKEARDGLNILGSDDLEFFNLKDFDLHSDGKTVEMLEKTIENYRPEILFVPFYLDNHPDHRESATITAHSLHNYHEPLVCYCYEVWTALLPNVLIDITDEMDDKIRALEAHWSQVTHVNLKSSIIGLNSYRSVGLSADIKFCEAFYKCSKSELIKIVLRE